MHGLPDSRTLPSRFEDKEGHFFDGIRHIERRKSLSDTWISQSGDFRANDRRQTTPIT